MAILPIYIYDQSVLRKKAKVVHPERADREEVKRLIEDMFETMHQAGGIGLAANQVGSLHRVIVVDVSDMEETKGIPPIAMVNPVVFDREGEWSMEEGCLSIPEIREEVVRAERIRVRYKDSNLVDRELEASGILGRVLLHEIDHLNGILFIDYLSADVKKILRGRLNKIRRGEIEVSYPIVAATMVAEHHKVAVK